MDRSVNFAADTGVVTLPGRKLLLRRTSMPVERPSSKHRSPKGAVVTSEWIWLDAWVQALTAELLAILKPRIISTLPVPDFGVPVDVPASTERAADSASIESLLPSLRRTGRSGRLTSITSWSHSERNRDSPAPYEPVPSTPKATTDQAGGTGQ